MEIGFISYLVLILDQEERKGKEEQYYEEGMRMLIRRVIARAA